MAPRLKQLLAELRALALLTGVSCLLLASNAAAAKPAPQPSGDIFYHVFVRSFRDSNGDRIGDLDGLTQELGYIQRLGVTTILLTPVQPSPFYHNYFATDFDGVAPEYGGKQAWTSLLRAAHKRGLKVYMDLEFQYLAGGHPWLTSAWGHPDSPYRDRVFWDTAPGAPTEKAPPIASPFGLYAGATDGNSYLITPVNLNAPGVRDYFRDYLLRWADPHGDGSGRDGVDGFRIDHMMDDLDNTHRNTNLFEGFWKPLMAAVKARRPGLPFVGEQWDWGYGQDFLTKGDVDLVFAFPLRGALISLDKSEILKEVAATEAATPAGKRQVLFLENHDTDRSMSMLGEDPKKARAAAAILMMLKGSPLIYYGQELGMRGKRAPSENTDAPDIPRRQAFPWMAEETANGSAIWYRDFTRIWRIRDHDGRDGRSLQEQDDDPGSLLNRYRQLTRLRHTRPELVEGVQTFPCPTISPVLCLMRQEGSRRTLLLVNLSQAPAAPGMPKGMETGLNRLAGQGELSAGLAPYEVRIAGTP